MDSNKKIESEISFKNLIKNPVRLFGLSYFYFFVLLLVVGVFYTNNISDISFNNHPISNLDSLNIERDILEEKGGFLPAVDLAKVKSSDEEMILKGKELYDANCSSCHGKEGLGNGPAGAALNPPARNFQSQVGWTNGTDIISVYNTLQNGILKNGMAAYEYLPPLDRISIIHYMRSFSAEFPAITDAQVSELDLTYNLSAETEKPNKISLKKSIILISEEFVSSSESIDSELSSSSESGAKLLLHHSDAPSNIIRSVARGEISLNLSDFVLSISHAPELSGFKSSVLDLNNQEWKDLHSFLIKFTKKG
ncbi:MAG: cytochrome c [Bacteroidetes bacterium]|nr:cytochrome c [Bacteroidota bacterium]